MYVVFSCLFFEAVTRVNNTLCFNCQDASSPEKCDTVDVCNYDEVWNYFNLKCFRTSNVSIILLKNHHFINLSEYRLFYIKDDNSNVYKCYTFINKIELTSTLFFFACCLLQNVSFLITVQTLCLKLTFSHNTFSWQILIFFFLQICIAALVLTELFQERYQLRCEKKHVGSTYAFMTTKH